MFGDPDKPPPGWWVSDGTLQPDTTLAGYLARLEEVRGVCHTRDCRRRCEIDLKRMAERGFGALPINAVKELMRCHRLDGCALDFHVDRRASLPLRALTGRSHVRVRIRCEGCRFHRVTTPEGLMAKIGGGDAGAVLVSEVASQVKGPCKVCGKTAWRADVLWPNPDSEGWRAAQKVAERSRRD